MNDEPRLQRVTAPDYLADLADADAAGIRARRDECQVEERRLSYIRRVVQGHLDLARAELARRRGDAPPTFVARVAHALTGPAGGARSPRAVGLYEPADADAGITVDTAELPDIDDATLEALVGRLRDRERALSDLRGVLLAHLDRLQDALVDHYRDDHTALADATRTLAGSLALGTTGSTTSAGDPQPST